MRWGGMGWMALGWTGRDGVGMGHVRMDQGRLGQVRRGWDPIPPHLGPFTSLSIQVLPRQVAKQPKVPRRTTTVPAPTRTKGTLVAFSSSREK